VTAQPRDKLIEAELVGVVEGGNERIGLLGVRREAHAVDDEKRIRCSESRPLVSVVKGWFCARLSQSAAACSIRSA